ncbi:MAG: YicC family protein [Spirochaetaceae bacterium]|nr:MAG: YicC family protein [Spirochaetaceae bacterium]
MRSMTAYAIDEGMNERFSVSLEMKSVNNRYLDVACNLPSFLAPLETELRGVVSNKVSRGRVDLTVRVRELQSEIEVNVDAVNAEKYVSALQRLADLAGIKAELRVEHLLGFEGLFSVEKKRDPEMYKPAIMEALNRALQTFLEQAEREGEKTQLDIFTQLERIERHLSLIEEQAPRLQQRIREQLMLRFTEMLGDGVDESRVYAETAVQLVKHSINEEIVRMRAHFGGFRSMVAEGGPMGKKLDFLCQELNREINTIGSKSFLYEIAEAVIEIKDAIENMREQLRNVE